MVPTVVTVGVYDELFADGMREPPELLFAALLYHW